MQLPCDKVDVDLFNASIIVTIGNGKMADFWDLVGLKDRHQIILYLSYIRKQEERTSRFSRLLENTY
jgi:hypothetical protein